MSTEWNRAPGLNMQIQRKYNDLTRMERKVADVVMQLGGRLIEYSIAELAAECQVSEPTVIRFCRSMGYRGIKELKWAAAQQEAPYLTAAPASHITDIKDIRSTENMVAFVFDSIEMVMRETQKLLDIESLDRAVELLLRAKYVKVVGFGGSAIVARHVQHYLRMAGKHVDLVNNYLPNDPLVEDYNAGDVVLAISFSGNTSMVVDIVEDAKRKGAVVVALTAWGENKLRTLSDVTLQSVYSGSGVIAGSHAVERMALIALFDVLLTGVYWKKNL